MNIIDKIESTYIDFLNKYNKRPSHLYLTLDDKLRLQSFAYDNLPFYNLSGFPHYLNKDTFNKMCIVYEAEESGVGDKERISHGEGEAHIYKGHFISLK